MFEYPFIFFYFFPLQIITPEPTSDIWLGMTNSVNKFKWQSTAELVTAGNWASGDLGPSELTADSAVVMNGSSSWVWEVVSRSDAAGVICQRSESSQLKQEGETELKKKNEREKME